MGFIKMKFKRAFFTSASVKKTLAVLLISSTLFACSSTDDEEDTANLVAELTDFDQKFELYYQVFFQNMESLLD